MTAASARVVLDVGAGDGRAALRLARREPATLAIALDPAMDRLRDGARAALRGRIPNALFVVAAVEALPPELDGRSDEIIVNMPWGSLLSGLVRGEERVLAPLARAARRGARVRVLLSVEPRDQAATGLVPADVATLAVRTDGYSRAGFAIERCAVATPREIAASGSSWAKRLGRDRVLHALTLRRR